MEHHEVRLSRRRLLETSARTIGAAALGGPVLLRGSVASAAANDRLNLAVVGCGGQGRGVMGWILSTGQVNLVALCDADADQIGRARSSAGERGAGARAFEDYRRLLREDALFDCVLIATPDHWHAPLCKAFMMAGKHVYCEKPLTHSVSEARELRTLARRSMVVTQMGNQGSASESLRRCVEIIKAGTLGHIREIYHWGIGVNANEGNAPGEDPIPAGFNWDLWVGPSAMRPFKAGVYHPASWRGWFDFGNGGLADFFCHAANLPLRALDLSYPEKLVLNVEGGQQAPGKAAVELHFGARKAMPPVVLHWMAGEKPPAHVIKPLTDVFEGKAPDGVLIIGEKGWIHTSHWNTDGLMQLQGEPKPQRVVNHAGTKDIAQSLPRAQGHAEEWVDACKGKGRTFSDFEVGGKLTEIGLAAVVAIREGKSLDWDGEHMRATNAPDADRFVHTRARRKWMV